MCKAIKPKWCGIPEASKFFCLTSTGFPKPSLSQAELHAVFGGKGGARTHTSCRTTDFKSGASTDFATIPYVGI